MSTVSPAPRGRTAPQAGPTLHPDPSLGNDPSLRTDPAFREDPAPGAGTDPRRTDRARVAVVLAVHNGADHLAAARAQIDALTEHDLQVLLVDDASDDGSSRTLRAWAEADPRTTLLCNRARTGVAASRNRALDHVEARYVWFTDCDDEWSPDLVQHLADRADATGADVVVCEARTRRSGQDTLEPLHAPLHGPLADPVEGFGRLLRGQIQGHLWNKLFRRELFDGLRFPTTRAHSDLAAVAALLARSRRTELLEEALYTYVLHEGSILNSRESRPEDLLDVRDHVRAEVETLVPTLAPARARALREDLLLFEYRFVYLALVHDAIRRDGTHLTPGGAAAQAAHRAITAPDVLRLARRGHLSVAGPAAAARLLHPLYAAAYTVYRRRKWGTVGFGAR